MFCQKCGKENPNEAKFCKHCGHDLNVQKAQEQQQEKQQQQFKQPQAPVGLKPKNYLIESILVTVLCCLPLGIVGIVFASKVDNLYRTGDMTGAQEASAKAKKFMTWGLVAGIVVYVLYAIVMLAGLGSAGY